MTPARFLTLAVDPAMTLLPGAMDSPAARAMVIAIALQETGLSSRRQLRGGPARGYAQFEWSGVAAVLAHEASGDYARQACAALDIAPTATSVHPALEFHDVLCCVFARLLLWTDHAQLPIADEPDRGWDIYYRCWRPGKPRPIDWRPNFNQAWRLLA